MACELHAYSDIIKFANAIMFDKVRNKGEQCLRCKPEEWNKEGTFYVVNNISEHVTLVQLMYSLGNVNHTVSLVGKWIFNSNYEKVLQLKIESLNLICSCSDEYQNVTIFNWVYYVLRHVNPKPRTSMCRSD